MKLLPIFWTEPPTAEDWGRLTAAREAIGYREMVKPVQALQGSPGTLLIIGTATPDWLHNYYRCVDITDEAELQWALDGALGEEERMESFAELLSEWMGVEVKQIAEEETDAGVRFS